MLREDAIAGAGNTYDFGARLLSSLYGSWFSIDPLAGKYPSFSPYVAMANNPINAIDPDGRAVIFVNGYRFTPTSIGEVKKYDHQSRTFQPIKESVFSVADIASHSRAKQALVGYWEGLDKQFMDRIGDRNAFYADGTNAPLSTAEERFREGVVAGEEMLRRINNKEITIASGETIKVITHSQGDAYGAGMISVLQNHYKIEALYSIAPKQPEDIPFPIGTHSVQYSSRDDFIAPQSPKSHFLQHVPDVPGSVKEKAAYLGTGGYHTIENYNFIFSIPQGEKGYVREREDK